MQFAEIKKEIILSKTENFNQLALDFIDWYEIGEDEMNDIKNYYKSLGFYAQGCYQDTITILLIMFATLENLK